MAISVIPAEAELRKIRARVTEVAWVIRALRDPSAVANTEALLNLVESWTDHQVKSLAATLVGTQQAESREAALMAIRDLIQKRSQLLAELINGVSRVAI